MSVTATIEDLIDELDREAHAEIRTKVESLDMARVFTPFQLDDGDLISFRLKRDGNGWVLSDEGFTITHLTYDLDERDLRQGNRKRIIDSSIKSFEVELRGRELQKRIHPGSPVAESFFELAQCCLRISNLLFLTRERVRTTFEEDLKETLQRAATQAGITYSWHDPRFDPHERYKVDAVIKAPKEPIFLFGLTGNTRVRDATIALLQYQIWKVPNYSIGVFEDSAEIERSVLDRFMEASDHYVPRLANNRERLVEIIQKRIAA